MGQKNKPFLYNEHHLRPRSRGGNNSGENCIQLNKKRFHDPYHWLFTNLRPHEIALLFIFSWKTQYIPNLRDAFYEGRFATVSDAWLELFGSQATVESAIQLLQKTFVRSEEDRAHMEWALKLDAHAGTSTIEGEKAPAQEREEWRQGVCDAYQCLFGSLDPHEAILITFFFWETVCPYWEFSTLTTNKLERSSMKKRKKSWNNMLFGKNAEQWSAVRIIESLCEERYYPQTYALVQEAIAICEAQENR